MLTVFIDRQGKVIFTYPNVDIHHGDKVKYNDKTYLVVSRTFDVQGGFYEVLLHESEEE